MKHNVCKYPTINYCRLVAIVILSFASFEQAWAQTELIVNGNFASGSTGWQLSGNSYADSRFSNCRSCPGYAYVSNPDGTPGNSLYGTLWQGITVPANATSVTFSFWYKITTQEVGSTPYDVLGIYVQNSSGSIIATLGVLSNVQASSVYQQATFDLTSYKGQSIRIFFLGTTNSNYPTTFRIDDVSVLATVPPPDVTLTLYVHDGSPSGPVIVGARVTGYDAAGRSFDQTTNASGYVTITGTPSGSNWQFTASKSGYQTKSWGQPITVTDRKDAYLQLSIPDPPVLIAPDSGATGVALTPTFQWNSVSTADYYGLYVSEPPYGPDNLVFDSQRDYGPIYGTSFNLPSGKLISGVKYYWNMRSHNSAGWGSSFSSSWNFTTESINQSPTCSLSANKYFGNAPLSVTFSMSANDPDGSISVWGLDVNGDGNQEYSGAGNPPSTQPHTYTTLGSYSVVLAVLDNDGASAVDTKTIVVGENNPPICSLSTDKNSGEAPLLVTFSMSANDTDGWISSWELLAGDGSPSYTGTGNPPSTKTHTYTVAGTYNAIFGVTDNEGVTSFDTQIVTVAAPPADITLTLYVHEGSETGPMISGARVTGQDAIGTSFDQTTNSSGYVTITGKPGTWQFTASKSSYETKSWPQDITVTCTKQAYLQKTPVTNRPPNPPTNLIQLKADGQTQIPVGSMTDKTTVVFKANVTDPDGDRVKLQVEARRVGDNFIPRFTHESGLISSSAVKTDVYGLTNGDYHWQARSVDEHGLASEWVSFGNNPELTTDFSVQINLAPVATFYYFPNYPEIGESVFFDAIESKDPDGGSIVSYQWDFGDEQSITSSNSAALHEYSTTGMYIVHLTVTDDEGTEGGYFQSVNVFSKELENVINDAMSDTSDLLDNIALDVSEVASCANYFNETKNKTKNKIVIDIAFEMLKGFLSLPEVKQVSALSIGDYVRLVEKYPDLKEFIDIIDNSGWILPEITKDKMEDALKAVSADVFERLEASGSYQTFAVDLVVKNSNRKNNLSQLKNEVLNNIGSLSQEEINLYKENIKKLSNGNNRIKDLYFIKKNAVKTLWDIKINEEGMLDVAFNFAKGSAKCFLFLHRVPIWVIDSLSLSAGLLKNINELGTDGQLASVGFGVLLDGFVSADHIFRNTRQALLNIQNRNIPPVVNGRIISIENYEEGYWDIEWGKSTYYNVKNDFYYRNKYSDVQVKNTGNVKARFELASVYDNEFSTGLIGGVFAPNNIPFVTAESKEIEPDQTGSFRVSYMIKNEGSDVKNKLIGFYLFAENNGIYGIDYNITIFGTKRVALNIVNAPEEELENAITYTYPIRSESNTSYKSNYTFTIYATNPFDFPIQANLIQQIPSNISIISTKVRTTPADFDNDGNVDMVDFAILASAWSTKAGDILWNPACDVSNPADNKIDVIDLAVLTKYWLGGARMAVPADFNIDGYVDFEDYTTLANNWMNQNCDEPDWCAGTDLNKSGVVDFADLAEFSEYWLVNKDTFWSLELGPEEKKEITIAFTSTQEPNTLIEIPGAKLKIYDQVNGNWLEFSSNDLSFKTTLQGDFDIDGNVDLTDFSFFANQWRNDCNSPDWCYNCDLNKSGSVDMLDLATFTEHWLEGI